MAARGARAAAGNAGDRISQQQITPPVGETRRRFLAGPNFDHLLDDNFLAALRWGRRLAALPEVNMPHDLDTSTGGIGAMLVHRNKQREVLARIND